MVRFSTHPLLTRSNDGFLFIALGYSIVLLFSRWEDYAACEFPLQGFLIVNYATILLFRSLNLVSEYVSPFHRTTGRVLSIIKIFLVYPFFAGWTVTGTYWFFKDTTCIHGGVEYTQFVSWLVLCYVWVIGYGIILGVAVCLGVFEHFLVPFEEENDIFGLPENEGLNERDIQDLPTYVLSKAEAEERILCSICLDNLEEFQQVKKLPNCGHRFHAEHIDQWLVMKSNCPLCRTPIYASHVV